MGRRRRRRVVARFMAALQEPPVPARLPLLCDVHEWSVTTWLQATELPFPLKPQKAETLSTKTLGLERLNELLSRVPDMPNGLINLQAWRVVIFAENESKWGLRRGRLRLSQWVGGPGGGGLGWGRRAHTGWFEAPLASMVLHPANLELPPIGGNRTTCESRGDPCRKHAGLLQVRLVTNLTKHFNQMTLGFYLEVRGGYVCKAARLTPRQL